MDCLGVHLWLWRHIGQQGEQPLYSSNLGASLEREYENITVSNLISHLVFEFKDIWSKTGITYACFLSPSSAKKSSSFQYIFPISKREVTIYWYVALITFLFPQNQRFKLASYLWKSIYTGMKARIVCDCYNKFCNFEMSSGYILCAIGITHSCVFCVHVNDIRVVCLIPHSYKKICLHE